MDGTALEHVTRHLDCDVYYAAARELGLDVELIEADSNFLRITGGGASLFICDNVMSLTDAALRQAANSKILTNRLLAGHGVPVPRARLFRLHEAEAIEAYVQAQPGAVVIKPNGGSLSRGVTRKPRTAAEIAAALEKLRAAGAAEALVESFAYGHRHRALVFQGEILEVLGFRPPEVVGDGIHTVAELVEAENRLREAKRLRPVVVDPRCLRVERVFEWEVLPAGYRLALNPGEDLHVGGTWEPVPEARIAPENLEAFRRAARATGLALCGVDCLTVDIGRPLEETGGVIQEINGAPSVYLHYFIGAEEDLAVPRRLLQRYFGLT